MTAIKPARRQDIEYAVVDGQAIVHDPGTDSLHYFSRESTLIFESFDGTVTMRELSQEIAGALGLDPAAIEQQVRTTHRELGKRDLLERPGRVQPSAAAQVDGRALVRKEVPRND